MKLLHRALSLLLALGLFTGLSLPGAWADASEEEIEISSAEELRGLAKRCSLDTWSQGKTVRLTADIDLGGQEFSPIPTFGGTFLGGGHSISGLYLTAGGSNMGLFRFVQRGAVIQDLHVSGSVIPDGGKSSNVGGVAGSNEGVIRNCSFSGVVSGESAVGGIAGRNGPGGELALCSAVGSVTGQNGTGGIAGRSYGLLLECENRARVNTSGPGPAAGLDSLNVGEALSQLAAPSDGEDSGLLPGSHSDTGGVVGYSAGVVQGCSNTGIVGYSHVGYNVGGVAGRQNGYMLGCSNSGSVYGRKDVGGVIGQAEPDVTLNAGEGALDQLRRELNTLSALIDRTIDHTDLSRGNISGLLSDMAGSADSARENTRLLLEQTADFVDKNVRSLNALRAAVVAALEGLAPAWEGLEDVSQTFSALCDELEGALDHLRSDSRLGREALEAAEDAVADLRRAAIDTGSAARGLRDATDALRRSVILQDREAISDAMENMLPELAGLGEALAAIGGSLDVLLRARGGNSPDNDPDEGPGQEEIDAAWDDLNRAISEMSAALGGIVQNLEIIGENVEVNWDLIQRALALSIDALGSLGTAAGKIADSMDDLQQALAAAGSFTDALGGAAGRFGGAAGLGSEIGAGLEDVFKTLDRVADRLARDGDVEFSPLGQPAREAGNELFSALSGLSGNMEALRAEMDAAGDTLSADLRAVNRQTERVFLALLDVLDDVQAAPEISELIGDASDEDIDDAHLGKAAECSNTGSVEGDRNVGGIVGAMAIEYDLDPEDDNTRFTLGSSYEIRAVLQNCVNCGTVTGRRDCVGGLAGRMDLGTVSGCVNYGGVASTGGGYVGGVAGYSDAAVRESWAKCSVSGENYVGGVAGFAKRMTGCRAIAVIEAGTQYVGAIAGDADVESGGVRGNFFVDMGLAGVDGVSYAGIAEPIPYESLLELPGGPAGFDAFTLTLTANGETVARFPFRYGEDLGRLPLPEVPAREGFYGTWPEFDRSGTRSDLTADAVYTPWVTLAASARREGKLPLVLAEGRFFEGAAPEVRDSALAPPEGAEDKACDIWEISLTGTELGAADSVPLRLLNRSGGKARVWQYVNGGWEQVEARANGHYLLLAMTGTTGVFCVCPAPGISPLVPALPLAAAGLCILLLVVLRRRAAKRKRAVPSE